MFQLIYIEKEVQDHPRTLSICKKFLNAKKILIDRYGEIFNRKAQNFRLQKKAPALIIAKKNPRFVLEVPSGYGLGLKNHYYFSHVLNCPFDCRYCFLQGMYASANYVLFVNFEDFQKEIESLSHSEVVFFTGYDGDSLALESLTHFAEDFLPFISRSSSLFEFRTKSVQIRPFLEKEALKNCILAWTLTPEKMRKAYEHKTPSTDSRLQAMEELQSRGWTLGLRFDPILEEADSFEIYQTFFREVFQRILLKSIHSVTLGSFRLPKAMFKKISALYPEEPLLAKGLREKEGKISSKNENLLSFCQMEVLKYVPKERVFVHES